VQCPEFNFPVPPEKEIIPQINNLIMYLKVLEKED
jgi:hypothetical protein